MPMPDVYDALARGVVDGLLSSYEALEGFRTGEHIKYVTENLSTAYSATFLVAMNKKKFESLPANVRKAIDDVSKEFMPKYGQRWDDIDREGLEFAKSLGNETIRLAPDEDKKWAALARPLVDDYIKRSKEKGIAGDEVVKFIDSFKK